MSKRESLKGFKAMVNKKGYITLEGRKEKFSKEILAAMSDEVWQLYAHAYWKEQKEMNRNSRCSACGKNGKLIRCPEENDCDECPYAAKDSQGNPQPGERTGSVLSLDAFEEMGIRIPGYFQVEAETEERDLRRAVDKALKDLGDEDYRIITLAAKGVSEREIAAEIGSKQRTVNDRKQRIRARLREVLKDFL